MKLLFVLLFLVILTAVSCKTTNKVQRNACGIEGVGYGTPWHFQGNKKFNNPN